MTHKDSVVQRSFTELSENEYGVWLLLAKIYYDVQCQLFRDMFNHGNNKVIVPELVIVWLALSSLR